MVRKPGQSQRRFASSPIAQIQPLLEWSDDMIPVLAGRQCILPTTSYATKSSSLAPRISMKNRGEMWGDPEWHLPKADRRPHLVRS